MSAEEIDFFQDAMSQQESVPQDRLKNITELVVKLEKKKAEAAALEALLKTTNEEVSKLEMVDLPLAMDSAGLPFYGLPDGRKVSVDKIIRASIPADRKTPAFEWLRANNHADLIKNELSVSLERGKDEEAKKITEFVKSLKLTCDQKESVHHMTLTSFVKEQMAKGKSIPLETLGVFIGRKATISKKK